MHLVNQIRIAVIAGIAVVAEIVLVAVIALIALIVEIVEIAVIARIVKIVRIAGIAVQDKDNYFERENLHENSHNRKYIKLETLHMLHKRTHS